MLSHELRTPLTLVKLSADLLAEDDLAPAQAEFVRTIREQASATIRLAEDLLTQARIEAGKFTPHLTTFDIADMVLTCVRDLRELYAIQIVLDCPSTPCPVHADAVLIRQGLTNLINNAIAVSSEQAQVTVRLARREFDCLVSVTDMGQGMDAARRLRLFHKFSSGRPVGSGTGLGLIITKQIIELHGGQLFIDTKEDRGTTVMFNLPKEVRL
jgi:signal transduction histidine kinase